jgi:hypothetical protein
VISDPVEWVGLGFVSTIENAPGEVLREIEGIEAVAAQIIWGNTLQKPDKMGDYLEDLERWGLVPVGWGWCNATDPMGAMVEGAAHARTALDLGLTHFIANMEEPYDAHGDSSSVRYHLPVDYTREFRNVAPDMHFAVTTTPRWASDQNYLREAGAVMMPQAFPLAAEGGIGVKGCVDHCVAWGWEPRYIRPLCQVYETNGEVPDAETFLSESESCGVGLIPYILEQALGGAGRELLSDLYPAITRLPVTSPEPEDPAMVIGKQHGIEATYNRLKALDPEGANPAFDPKRPFDLPLDQMKAYDKWCRTMTILVSDHDANI